MAEIVEKKKIGRYIHYRCIVCGEWFKAKDRRYKHTCSTECSVRRMTENYRQLYTKQGPAYQKWLDRTTYGMRVFLGSLEGG